MKYRLILSAFAAALALVACKPSLNIAEPLINTGAVSYEIPSEGGTVDVTFRSNLPWHIELAPANATSSVAGITVKPSSGEGSTRDITVTVRSGANSGAERRVLLTIFGEGASAQAAVRLIQPKQSVPGEDDGPAMGTLLNPYPADKLHADILAGNIPDGSIYIRGKVSKVKEISAKPEGYGNATFWLTDSGDHPATDVEAFQVYRAKDIGLADIENVELLNEGDVVTVYGPVMLYGGTTPETKQNEAAVLAVNGLGTPQGDGSAENPYNVGAAMKLIGTLGSDVSSDEVHVKGIISEIVEFYPPNGNYTYYITDDGYHPSDDATVLYIYRSKYFGGANYTSAEQLKLGDEVVVRGTLKNYGGTMPEMNTGGQLVLLNGNTE
ncbi:MAG: hypothetical protein IJ623_06810 [Bacteroidales bacterium]|nr:hypothetical protein [Bacteroidales bacterium]